MVTVEQAKLQFAQQRNALESGRQSAIQARQQLAQFQTSESPSISQLLGRGMTGALQARSQELQARQLKAEGYKSLEDYEKSLGEAEKQLVSQEKAVQAIENESLNKQQEYQRGYDLAFSNEPYRVAALTSPESRQGYKAGQSEKRFREGKTAYQKQLREVPSPSQTQIEFKEVLVPTSILKNVPTVAGGLKAPEAESRIQELKSQNLFFSKTTPLQRKLSSQGFPSWITGIEPQPVPQAERKPFTLFGQLDIAAQKYGEPAFQFLQKKEEQVLGKKIVQSAPYQALKSVREFKTPSPIGIIAETAFFSPLLGTAAAKKGSKQVVVEKTKEEAKKEAAEKLAAIRAKIRENALTSPASNREALVRLYDSGNKEAAKNAEKLLRDELGKGADELIKDARSQSVAFKPQVTKPVVKKITVAVPKEEAARSAYYGMPEYSFAETQISTSKVIGATPAQLNLKGIGIVAGIKSSAKEKAVAQAKSNFLSSRTSFKSALGTGQASGLGLKQPSASITSPMSIQIPSLSSINIPKLEQPQLSAQSSQQSLRQQLGTEQASASSSRFNLQQALNLAAEQEKRKIRLFGKPISSKKSKAYRAFVIRRGKQMFIGKPTTRGRALSLGQNIAAGTLARTFGIKPVKDEINLEDIKFQPSPMFRGYRLKKGRRIPLMDTFIQKARFSLSSSGERREIKSSRKKKRGFRLW